MIVRSLNIARPETVEYDGRAVETAIYKRSVAGPVFLTRLNFAGDEQGDPVHHGGPDKAVCLYSFDHYPTWEQELGRPLPLAAFGENLTIEGLTEETAQIGDLYRVGTAVVEVCQPRIPCFKLAMKFGVPDMVARVVTSGFTGFYVRVRAEGAVSAGDDFTLLDRTQGAPTVAFANRIFHQEKGNREGARRLLETPALADVWRKMLSKRLA